MPHTLIPVLVPLIITLIISSLAAMLAFKAPKSREKASPYECGFDPKNSARTPFSNRFFMIAVLFLIFDIEIVILLPLPLFSTLGPLVKFTSLVILVILLIGTLHEMRQGALDWKDAH